MSLDVDPAKLLLNLKGDSLKLSVLLPVHNSERYLSQAIQSVVCQSFRDFELIIVDDGSSDASLHVCQEFERNDARIKIISRPNTGIVGALNDGLAASKGEFIGRMDADDISYPDRFERQLLEFARRPKLVLLGSQVRAIDADGCPIRYMCQETENATLQALLLAGDGHAILHPAVMMRATAIGQIGGYRPEYPISEDLDLYLRMAELGEVGNCSEVLLDYRHHESSITNRPNKAMHFAQLAVSETRARRGLPPLSLQQKMVNEVEIASPGQIARRWSWWAWGSGFGSTARKYARRAIFADPTSFKAWQLLYVTHLRRPPGLH